MLHHVPPAIHYSHLDLISGRIARIPLELNADRQRYMLEAMFQSQEAGAMAVEYTPSLLLEVDFSYVGCGVATLGLVARTAIGQGIQPGDPVAFAACAASWLASETVYAKFGRYYLDALVEHPKAPMPAFIGEPEDFPWGASFLFPGAAAQNEDFRYHLNHHLRTLLATALNHCRAALARNLNPRLDD